MFNVFPVLSWFSVYCHCIRSANMFCFLWEIPLKLDIAWITDDAKGANSEWLTSCLTVFWVENPFCVRRTTKATLEAIEIFTSCSMVSQLFPIWCCNHWRQSPVSNLYCEVNTNNLFITVSWWPPKCNCSYRLSQICWFMSHISERMFLPAGSQYSLTPIRAASWRYN